MNCLTWICTVTNSYLTFWIKGFTHITFFIGSARKQRCKLYCYVILCQINLCLYCIIVYIYISVMNLVSNLFRIFNLSLVGFVMYLHD